MFFVTKGQQVGAPSTLEFGGSVSGGQTVDLTGAKINDFIVQVDDPNRFNATIDLHDFSMADLVGLAHADSWSYNNDMLSIKTTSGKVCSLDKFHIVSDASSTGSVHGLSVSKSMAGDVLVSPGTDFSGSFV